MSRRRQADKREVLPDAKFGDVTLAKFMNVMMYDGKKSVAEGTIYQALDRIAQRTRNEPLRVFHDALKSCAYKPAIREGVGSRPRNKAETHCFR